jgi:two-component system response regulator MtrA
MPKPTVLVADDHDVARTLVVHTLTAIGFEVVAVADGGAALEAARAQRPSMMLIDVNMPVMNGFELLRALKADANLADIPVIMLTASDASNDVVAALDSGAADYITKPFSPAELLARLKRVKRAMDGQRTADRAARAG